jgi:hypothetical protein
VACRYVGLKVAISNPSHYSGPANGGIERRKYRRERADSAVELIWKEDGRRRFECARSFDCSPTGVGVASPQPIDVSTYLILRAPGIGIVALSQVRNCIWSRTQYHLGIQFMEKAAAQPPNPGAEPDHHILLRAGVAGDAEGLDRLYRSLAFRYHPDNRETGNSEIFLRIKEAYRILSPSQAYRSDLGTAKPAKTIGAQMGLRELKDKRVAVLELLFQKRVNDYRNAFVSPVELQSHTGMEADEVGFILWYLREKGAVTLSDNSPDHMITAAGVDILESAQSPASASTPPRDTHISCDAHI